MSLNFLATRFQCTWPWSTLVMLCDGRLVCGCADPYGKRVLGDARTATVHGVWNALNLDGGGSTSMAMEDPATHNRSIVNVSSDNPAGRSVGSSLAVFARPNPKP